MPSQFYSGIQSNTAARNRSQGASSPSSGTEASIQQLLAAQAEQKKVNDKVLKQNTSLLMLNAKLVKDLESLKAHASDLQCTTEALRADLAAATATKSVTDSKKKATERLHSDLSVRCVAKAQILLFT